MIKKITILFSVLLASCIQNSESKNNYLDYSSKEDKLSGAVKIIQIQTPSGKFNVWTKRIGNNPTK